MMKKLVSLLLVAALLLTVLPVAALATDTEETVLASSTEEPVEVPADSTQTAEQNSYTQEPEESVIIAPQSEMAISQEELENTLEGVMLLLVGEEILPEGQTDASIRSATAYTYGGMTVSQELVNFIKGQEGFSKYPMWDHGQYSVGYGTRCPDDKFEEYTENGIPEDEAEQLLKDFIASFSAAVNKMAVKHSIFLSQNQFDALVSFSYNVGTGWASNGGWRISGATANQMHAQDWTTSNTLTNPGWYFLNALGSISHASDAFLGGLATRRILEMEIFTYGNYYNKYSNLLSSGDPCHYTYLYFDLQGGTAVKPAGLGDWCACHRHYFAGEPYGTLMGAAREGYTFAGWYTGKNGTGEQITASTLARVGSSAPGFTVYAYWLEGTVEGVDPQIGTAENNTGSGAAANNGSTAFKDTKISDWFTADVERAAALGLVTGHTDGSFRPLLPVTRAEAIAMLYRMSNAPAATAVGGFNDVNSDIYYADAVAWAVAQGIAEGYPDGSFCPDLPITREQLATFLFRYAKAVGADTSAIQMPDGFADVGMIQTYAREAMYWAVNSGLIKGVNTTTLDPMGTCTRAQTATILVRYAQ